MQEVVVSAVRATADVGRVSDAQGRRSVWERLVHVARRSPDPAVSRHAHLLAILLVVLTVVFLSVDLAFVLTVPNYSPPWFGYAFLVGSYWLNRRGLYRVASTGVVAMFPIVAFAHIALGAAVETSTTLSYLMVSPLIGAIFLPIAGVTTLVAVNLLGIVALSAAIPGVVGTLSDLVGPLSGNAIAGALAVLYMHHRNRVESDRQALLRTSEERLRIALSAASMGTWDWSPKGNATVVNRRTAEIFGLGDEPMVVAAAQYFDAVHPDDRARVDAAFEQLARGPTEEVHVEHRIIRPDAATRWIRVCGRAARDAEGALTRVTGVVGDISDAKALADQLRQAQKMEAIGQFAGGVAHDFNNMLTVILSSVSELKAAHDDEQLDDIETAGRSAASLTEQLLAFSRHARVEPRVLDLNHIVTRSVKLLDRIVREDVSVEVELSGEPVFVEVDERQIQQCLLNLVSNARDAMPAGGTIRIAVHSINAPETQGPARTGVRHRPHAVLTIEDDGEGMDADTRERVFEPFFTSKEVGEGTGLGLSMVFGVVSRAGGSVEVDSDPGKGATFRLLFPVAQPDVGPTAQADVAPRGHGESVLLVEDDDGVRRVVCRMLEHFGYRVTTASSADEALELHGDGQTRCTAADRHRNARDEGARARSETFAGQPCSQGPVHDRVRARHRRTTGHARTRAVDSKAVRPRRPTRRGPQSARAARPATREPRGVLSRLPWVHPFRRSGHDGLGSNVPEVRHYSSSRISGRIAPLVPVVEATDSWKCNDSCRVRGAWRGRSTGRCVLAEPEVAAVIVIVAGILANKSDEMTLTQHHHVIERDSAAISQRCPV